MYHVYAICHGHELYLREQFSGTRYQCEKFIKARVSQGLPTHFLLISKLHIDAASKRYLP